MTTININTHELNRETSLMMGYKYKYVLGSLVVQKPCEPSAMNHIWNPCGDILTALEIVKKFTLHMHFNGVEWVVYTNFTSAGHVEARHAELGIAICLSLIEHKHATEKYVKVQS